MKRLSQHILAVIHQYGERISNLQLQKILYFTFGEYIRQNKSSDDILKELYTEKFEAWTYGPVLPSIYQQYKKNGSFAINDIGHYEADFALLDETIKRLSEENIYTLVEESHKHHIWQDNSDAILNRTETIFYELEDLKDVFLC